MDWFLRFAFVRCRPGHFDHFTIIKISRIKENAMIAKEKILENILSFSILSAILASSFSMAFGSLSQCRIFLRTRILPPSFPDSWCYHYPHCRHLWWRCRNNRNIDRISAIVPTTAELTLSQNAAGSLHIARFIIFFIIFLSFVCVL